MFIKFNTDIKATNFVKDNKNKLPMSINDGEVIIDDIAFIRYNDLENFERNELVASGIHDKVEDTVYIDVVDDILSFHIDLGTGSHQIDNALLIQK